MAKAFKKQKQSTPSGGGKDYYAGLTKETSGDKTYAIEPTGEKTLLDEEGDPVMDIELNPHLYPEYTAKFANNPNPDVEMPATPGIKDTQDQMAWNAKWNKQEEAGRNRRAFRKEVKFQTALGEENPTQSATDVIYPKVEEFEWANPVINEEKANQQSQEKQIAALVNSGMTVEDATQQVTTGKPVNEFFSENGNPLVKTSQGWTEVFGSGQTISPDVPFVDVQEMMKSMPNDFAPSKNLPRINQGAGNSIPVNSLPTSKSSGNNIPNKLSFDQAKEILSSLNPLDEGYIIDPVGFQSWYETATPEQQNLLYRKIIIDDPLNEDEINRYFEIVTPVLDSNMFGYKKFDGTVEAKPFTYAEKVFKKHKPDPERIKFENYLSKQNPFIKK
jgi:hypothetical protein